MRPLGYSSPLLLVVGLVTAVGVSPATAVTRPEVDASWAGSQDAYTIHSRVKAEFDTAAHPLAETELALETAETSEARIRGLVELRQQEQETHVHLQIHPSGRGGPAINPYPTVASVCF